MKKISSILMTLVIIFGLVLALTPIFGSLFFPESDNATQMAKSEVAQAALARWFDSPVGAVVDVHAVRQFIGGKHRSRFSFSTPSGIVRKFISNKHMQQRPLTDEIMQFIFVDKKISWWQPEALQRETYFAGVDQGRRLSLIYNAETKRGVLVIE